jgi:protein kinase-like protein
MIMNVTSSQVAGRYRLVEQLGTGGMGRVWLARDEMLHRDVAIKEIALPEGLTAREREELRQLTLREARAAAQLSHPNVVGVYDVLYSEERPWIVMEYVPSRSLIQVVHEDGPLSPRRTAEIGLAVLGALRAAHAAGVVHRDVKPANVLLAEDGRVVLTDFGLAVFVSGEGAVTSPGVVRGSPQYMSPERARDGVAGPESDLWSLGATLYTSVEGRSPYARDSVTATLTALATKPPDPAPSAGPLRPVLEGLLRKNPARRLSAEAVERALREVAGKPADPDAAGGSRGGRRLLLVAGAVVVAVAIAAAMAFYQVRGASDTAMHGVVLPPLLRSATVGVPDCPPATGPIPPAQRSHEYALVSGWVWYDDPGGFSMAVPDGWSYGSDGSTTCFHESGGDSGRVLAVVELPEVGEDLVGYWRQQEEDLVAAGRLPAYQPISITNRDYYRAAADWEFTYDAAGTGRHAVARGFQVVPGQTFAIHWITPEFDWQVNREYFNLVVASFAPAGL